MYNNKFITQNERQTTDSDEIIQKIYLAIYNLNSIFLIIISIVVVVVVNNTVDLSCELI